MAGSLLSILLQMHSAVSRERSSNE